MTRRPIIYLAAPYSHRDETVRTRRYELVNQAAAKLVSEGNVVFSPLTMTHPLDQILADTGDTLGSQFWVEFDETFMEFCTEIRVLMLDGWEESRGVKREVLFFSERGRKVSYLHKSFAGPELTSAI